VLDPQAGAHPIEQFGRRYGGVFLCHYRVLIFINSFNNNGIFSLNQIIHITGVLAPGISGAYF
jgi:hypothetical protein